METIRRYGYEEIYEGRAYTVLNIDDMKYWTMGAPVTETILINRKVVTPAANLSTADDASVHADDQTCSDPNALTET